VPLRDENSQRLGEVRLAVSQDALHDELEELRRSLRIRISIAGAVALLLLVVGLFYLLHLLKKNRELERARQSAARASYVGLLASGLAHEIRNPLNAMNMNIQMLEEELSAQPASTDAEHAEPRGALTSGGVRAAGPARLPSFGSRVSRRIAAAR